MATVIRLGARNAIQLHEMFERAFDDAARCLADVTGKDVAFDASPVRLAPARDAGMILGNPDRSSVALRIGIRGGLSGSLHIIATMTDMQRMLEKLTGVPAAWIGAPDPQTAGALSEYGTILASFLLNAITQATGIQATSTTPVIQHGLRQDVLTVKEDGPDVVVTELAPFIDGGVTHSVVVMQLDAMSLDLVMRWMWRNSAAERASARKNGGAFFSGAS